MEREYKTFDFTVKDFDFEGRTVEGYAAAFGNVDLGQDLIHEGAFAKTLLERGNKVKFLWQHDQHEPLGRPIEMHEDSAGLFVKAIISDTARGRDALALLRDEAISGLSIGYDAIPGGTDYSKSDDGETVRNLRELRLWEFSLVSMPMNEAATVTALKTEEDPDKSINLTGRIDAVRSAFNERFNPSSGAAEVGPSRYWINTVYDDHVIIDTSDTTEFFSVAYTMDADGNIVFAAENEWTPGIYTFIPVVKSADELKGRKQELVTTLRAALVEAEALLAVGVPAGEEDPIVPPIVPQENELSTPADNAGREDEDADDLETAGPEDTSPTAEETERLRLDVLERLESIMED